MDKFGQAPMGSVPDPRIRLENAEYRVTAPNGRQKDGRFFVNGNLVIERKVKASLGEASFVQVATLTQPSKSAAVDPSFEEDRQREIALWSLLSMGGE